MLCAVCQKPTALKCARCKSVFYCCVEHQRQHWREGHRAQCFVASAASAAAPREAENATTAAREAENRAAFHSTAFTTNLETSRQDTSANGASTVTVSRDVGQSNSRTRTFLKSTTSKSDGLAAPAIENQLQKNTSTTNLTTDAIITRSTVDANNAVAATDAADSAEVADARDAHDAAAPLSSERAVNTDAVTTPSTVNRRGEAATLLRPRMSAAYYDAAEQAYQRVQTMEFSSEDVQGGENAVAHPNAQRTVHDFIRQRLHVIEQSRITAALAQATGSLSVGEMLRNGMDAARSLLGGRSSSIAVPRDPEMAQLYDRMERAIPQNVPLSFFCGFADATMEMQMLLRDLSLERRHTDSLLVAAVSTCAAMYVVVQDRIRDRMARHSRGSEQHPEVVEMLDRLKDHQANR